MSIQGQSLLQRLSNIFTKDQTSVLGQMLQSVGVQLDAVDPAQTGLADQFAISTASGKYLDLHGSDWGVTRQYTESDDAYRNRIKAALPYNVNGPTIGAIKGIVQTFTGYEPVIIEYGPQCFTMGVTELTEFTFTDHSPFDFEVQVVNPHYAPYDKKGLEAAINNAKPARSSATVTHQGGDTRCYLSLFMTM
jgi:hypothetical protein